MQNPTFDLSKTKTLIISLGIMSAYVCLTIPELSDPKDWPDWDIYKAALEKWQPSDMLDGFDYHLRNMMGKFSMDYLHNNKVVPFASSIGLLILTYLISVQFTGKRFAGILGMVVVMASVVYRQFDTSAPHGYEWAVFFMAAIYFVKRKWQLSPVMFISSILCKSLGALFLPALLYVIYKSDISRKAKIIQAGTYGAFAVSFVILSTYLGDYQSIPFNAGGFLTGAASWLFFYVVPDFWIAALMPTVMFLLLALWGKKNQKAGVVLVCMINMSIYGAFLHGLTDDIWNEPYRYAPLLSMFGVGLGVVITGFIERIQAKKQLSIDLGKL